MAQADLWAQQQAQPDYYTAAYYGQPPQSWGWQQSSDYEQQPGPGAPPAADEPQPPGQEAEVPPAPPDYPASGPEYDAATAYQGWQALQNQQQGAWNQYYQQQQQQLPDYSQQHQQHHQQTHPASAGHQPGYAPSMQQPQAGAAPQHPPAAQAHAQLAQTSYHAQPHAAYAPAQHRQQAPLQRAQPPAQQAQHQLQHPQQGPAQSLAHTPQAQQSQQGRPFAQPGAEVGFRVPVRMPRQGRFAAAQSNTPASTPAFVPVASAPATRRPAAASAPAAAAAGQGSASAASFPPSLREFVTRSLKTVMAVPQDSARMHALLKQLIGEADLAGERWTKDWDTEPIPSLDAAAAAGRHSTSLAARPASAQAAGAFAGLRAGTTPEPPAASRSFTDRDGQPLRGKRALAVAKKVAKAERKRAKRFRGTEESPSPGDSPDPPGTQLAEDDAATAARNARFGDGSVQGGRTMTEKVRQRRRAGIARAAAEEVGAAEDQRWDDFVIRGGCQQLEKSYFRLTAAPDPADVRPEPVLRRALQRLVGLLAAPQPVKYLYALDQFKGMRQDLTVQHLGGSTAAGIYEAAARAALEHGDLPEYHQCQARLDALYAGGVQGCREEFLAYRLLYQVAHSAQSGGAAALLSTLRLVTAQVASHPAVAHAMRVRKVANISDAAGLCALYASAPGLGRALLDLMLPRARFSGLKTLASSYQAPLPVPLLAGLLGFCDRPHSAHAQHSARGVQQQFEADEARDVLPGCTRRVFPGRYGPAASVAMGTEQCRQWLVDHNAVLTPSSTDPGELQMDCRASRGQLAVPQDTTAVAHGDVNINVTDFLKSVLS